MVRYFIDIEDYLEKNKDFDIEKSNINLYKKKKNRKGLYSFTLIENEYKYEIFSYIKKGNNKKSYLLVEIFNDELKKYDELLIKEYEKVYDNLYKKKIYLKDNVIKLINFDSIIDMNMSEINKGDIVILEQCKSDSRYLYITANRGYLYGNLNENRNKLNRMNIGSDIYFHTNDEFLLNKYEDNITTIKEIESNKYKILNHKVYILDAIKNSDLYGMKSSTYIMLDNLMGHSIPVYISDNYEICDLSINDDINYNRKGYIIKTSNLKKMLKNNDIIPLLSFINIYELEDGHYNKYPVNNSNNIANTLKYKKINKKIQ